MAHHNIKELLEKKYLGDKLTDQELMTLAYHLGQAAELLVQMGGIFFLAFKESNSIYLDLYSSAVHRGLINDRGKIDLKNVKNWLNLHG